MRQALACLFDSAMRKAEAARGALRGGATGSVILPSRVIFEAALEYGRSGAGYATRPCDPTACTRSMHESARCVSTAWAMLGGGMRRMAQMCISGLMR